MSKTSNKRNSSKNNKKKSEIKDDRTLFQQVMDYFVHVFSGMYVIAILVVFPLYMENKYLNMGTAKYNFFMWVSLIFLGCIIISSVVWGIAYRKNPVFHEKLGSYSSSDWCAFAFLIISFISYLLSANKNMAFYGYKGWYMGLVAQTIFVLAFFFISRFWPWTPLTIELGMGTGAAVFLIAVLQRFNIDFLRLYDNLQADGSYKRLSDENVEKFVSTLGQTSWYSGYAMLILPFGMFWYYNDNKLISRILSGVFIVLGAASVCTVNSDSAYVALAIIFMVFVWFSLENNEKFARVLELMIIFLGTFRVIGILQDLFPERMIKLITGTEATTSFLNHSPVTFILLIVLVAFYLAYRIYLKRASNEKTGECSFDISKFIVLRKVMIYAAIVSVWGVVLMIILTTQHKLPDFMSRLYDVGFLNFTESWGNHRGFNWRMAIRALMNSSPKEWLVGVGPDCFALSMDKYFYDEVHTYWNGKQLACAHSELLNMLVTEGILGLAAYAGIFITLCIRLGKTVKKEPLALPFLAAILSYLGYNIFCYQQCIGTTFIFVLMGIGEMIVVYTNKQQEEKK